MAHNYSGSSETNVQGGRRYDKSRRGKRPEREIYRPGPVRQKGGQRASESQDDQDDRREDFQMELQELTLEEKRRLKRPDLQIYVPRARKGSVGDEFSADEPRVPSPPNRSPRGPIPDHVEQKHVRSESPRTRNDNNNHSRRGDNDHPRRGSSRGRHGSPATPRLSHEAEDAGRQGKPPRRGSGRGRPGSGSRALRKSNSLEWDDNSVHVLDHGWGTDLVDDDSERTKRPNRRERRSSGQRGGSRKGRQQEPSSPKVDNAKSFSKLKQEQSSSPKNDRAKGKDPQGKPEPKQKPSQKQAAQTQQQSKQQPQAQPQETSQQQQLQQQQQQQQQQQPPKITTDEKVEKSINKGTFQGLVFTNSRLDSDGKPESPQGGPDKKPRQDTGRNPDHRKRQDRSKNNNTDRKRRDELPAPEEEGSPGDGGMSWNEQVEAEEKLQKEEDERSRITAVIQEREKNMERSKKEPAKPAWKQRRDSDRDSDREDRPRRGDRSGKSYNQNRPAKEKQQPQGKAEEPKPNLNLKVTFGGNNVSEDRKVHMSEKKESDRKRNLSGDQAGRHGRGGLIKLPDPQTHQPAPQHHPHHHHHPRLPHPHSFQPPHRQPHRGGHNTRGSTHRTLYDPNNPNKPRPPPLHFYDPEPQHSPPYYSDQYHHSSSPKAYYEYGYPPSGQQYPQPSGMAGYNKAGYMRDIHTPPSGEDFSREQYYRSGFAGDHPSRGAPPTNRPKAEELLKEMVPLDGQLCNLVSRACFTGEVWTHIQNIRTQLQELCERLVLLDPELVSAQNVDQMLWKTAYYQVIEMMRKQLSEAGADTDRIKDLLLGLLDEGTTYYEDLLKSLQKTYSFNIEDYIDPTLPHPATLGRLTKLALYCTQKVMIFLGDIARYKEQVNQTANYGKARNWYLKAQHIAPKNGRPYNQLAILALYTRRKLDAVYYYMRSLAASNPFITARESLMSLFDEARKRAEVSEKKRLHELAQRKKLSPHCPHNGGPNPVGYYSHGGGPHPVGQYTHRTEIWVSPDGTTLQDEISADNEWDDLKKISAVELNKRFVLSFLNVHGKLFTKIGMETFPEVSSQMLHEFQALLSHSPSPIGNSRLLQLVTINMSAIENATPTASAQLEDNCRSLHQDQSVQLGLDMFGLLADRCVSLLKAHLESGDFQILSEDLHCLIPSVKVWADWMMCHADLWNPPPLPRDPELGPVIDVWKSVASLCNVLRHVDISHVKIYPQKKEGCDPILLQEDSSLAGFVPLLSLPQNNLYVHSTFDKDVARDCLRVDKLRTFGDYLYGIDNPLLSYNAETREYVSIAPETGIKSPRDDNRADVSDDVIIESDSEGDPADLNQSFGSSGDEGHIRSLKARKEELERKMAEKERQQQNIRAVLDDSDQKNRRTELEVRPMILVPDTNCFIDHLTGIEQLVAIKKFTVVVPLIVINELDGLAKGSREGQYDTHEHAEMVYSAAQGAVRWLEARFTARDTHLRALTSKGTVMDTIAFRAEDTSGDVTNNDDVILTCCLHYCKDKARDFMPKTKNEPIKLYREVVLLTDDRNLRLKAHTRNVPVKDIPMFMKWAKIG